MATAECALDARSGGFSMPGALSAAKISGTTNSGQAGGSAVHNATERIRVIVRLPSRAVCLPAALQPPPCASLLVGELATGSASDPHERCAQLP